MEKRRRPPKAYRNLKFLNSNDARTIRILAEFYEPKSRFRDMNIHNLIVFFGSARANDMKTTKTTLTGDGILDTERGHYRMLLARYYEDAVELSRRLTAWSMNKRTKKQTHYVCSGGGPGIMEAANKGASEAGGKSIGLNISLPMEQYPNPYITEELSFEFHYFFMRKFWFVYLAKALVIFPGGFGTMDELWEVLTLIQTQKIKKKLPLVIYGSDYWNQVINFDTMVKWGTISANDLNLIHFSDDVDDAFSYLAVNLNNNSTTHKL